MSGTTRSKTFYIPVGDMSAEEALKLVKKFKKTPDGTIKLKEEK
jgi:hypothetical protein